MGTTPLLFQLQSPLLFASQRFSVRALPACDKFTPRLPFLKKGWSRGVLLPAFVPLFFYIARMKQVAVGIVSRDGHVLACQRHPHAAYPLKWEFPGGKIESGESPRQALTRELREELAIEAEVGEELYRQEWIYPDGVENPKKDGAFRVFYYYIKSFTGTPKNVVFEQIRWVSLSELQTLDLLEGNRDAVAFLVKHGISTQ